MDERRRDGTDSEQSQVDGEAPREDERGGQEGKREAARGKCPELGAAAGSAVGGEVWKILRDKGVDTAYRLPMAGRLTDIEHGKGSEILAASRFELDSLGRRTARTGSGLSTLDLASVTPALDANGNLLTRTGGDHTWSTRWAGFDKPRWLADKGPAGTKGSEFLYNAARQRVAHLEFDAMSGTAPNEVPGHYTLKRLYAWGATGEIDYKNTAPTGTPAWQLDKVRLYVPGPEGVIGTMEFCPPAGTTAKPLVYHYDHLGSIQSITPHGSTATTYAKDSANKDSLYAYDAWGQRRDPLDWTGAPTATADGGPDDAANRGYTGHEMLDDIGLVHMNGRIYDPLLGRMLSADLFVQDPKDLQCYNRYSYCRNNPLSKVDPSGFADKPATNELDWDDVAAATGRQDQWATDPMHPVKNTANAIAENTSVQTNVKLLDLEKVKVNIEVTVPLSDPKNASAKGGVTLPNGSVSVRGDKDGVALTGTATAGDATVSGTATKDGAEVSGSIELPQGSSLEVSKECGKGAPPETSFSLKLGPITISLGGTLGISIGIKDRVEVKAEADLTKAQQTAASKETGSYAQEREAARKAAEEAAKRAQEEAEKSKRR